MTKQDSLALNRARTGITEFLIEGNHPRYWLLVAPALIVSLYQVGRGLGNTGYLLYWIAAIFFLLRQRGFIFPGAALLLYVVLLSWGTLSAALSLDSHSAYGKWAQYALLGSGYFMTWWLVRLIPEFNLERALRMIGVVGLLSFAYYAGQYLVLSNAPDFHPEAQVHGLVPAYLSPFALYLLWQTIQGKRGVLLVLAYLLSLTLLLVFSNSLTEVLTLAASLVTMAFFVIRNKRLLLLFLTGVALLFIVLIFLFDPAGAVLNQAEHSNEDWFAVLNKLSSYRTYIWYKALTIPPPNQWLGVGPSNVSLYPPVVIDGVGKVGHLHNLLLDCWYELGVVGLVVYLLFYVAQVWAMKYGMANSSASQRGLMYAAIAGIFVASMLEQSYRSPHAALFVPFLFALYSRGCTKNPSGTRG